MGIFAARLSVFIEENGSKDSSAQKAGILGSAGCSIEHSAMLWQIFQEAKRKNKDVVVVRLAGFGECKWVSAPCLDQICHGIIFGCHEDSRIF